MRSYVEVTEDATGKIVKRLGPMGLFKADKVESGIEVNLNHEKFSVRVVESEFPENLPEGAEL